jgi:hypothetical protein
MLTFRRYTESKYAELALRWDNETIVERRIKGVLVVLLIVAAVVFFLHVRIIMYARFQNMRLFLIDRFLNKSHLTFEMMTPGANRSEL